ncbi:hypothetical protein K7X08_028158 [Anisodus acutangulus]|uniref:Uncharacterized protein n=1 Tax=Anisodus acutangulus TaxID=402998 RepID=A0A9Q1MU48_9SOLA|nr:hypothetical protein K7X08_028158 [Anisodus acutangulus]
MGRGRGKGKKMTVIDPDDPGSDEEEKIPTQKRRGRPQKSLKDNIDEEAAEMIEEEDSDNEKIGIQNLEIKGSATENGKKRKKNNRVKEKNDSVKEENGEKTSLAELLKLVLSATDILVLPMLKLVLSCCELNQVVKNSPFTSTFCVVCGF